jgi:hypothetical protein
MNGLRTIAEAATPGPWERDGDTVRGWKRYMFSDGTDGFEIVPSAGAFQSNEDAEFIATFDPETVLALLDVAEALAAVDRWERSVVGEVNDFTSLIRIVRPALDRLREVTP